MKPEELQEIAQKEYEYRLSYKYRVNVCCGSVCTSLGALETLERFKTITKDFGLEKVCKIARVGCIGTCSLGPIVLIEPGDYLYEKVTVDKVDRIIKDHIVGGKPINEYLFKNNGLFRKEYRLVLKNSGKIDPFRIEDYIAFGGYLALAKALFQMTPEQVIYEVTVSGLRGRGGAGFPTGRKWNFVAKNTVKPKYIVANFDEGDPGVFANRVIAESNPHSIIEGIIIAAYAVGAERGYIYVRSEYPLAIKILETALGQSKNYGLLGKNILGSTLSFDIELRTGAGSYVAGEETAILASIEGKRAMPRPRPPYPAVSGLFGKPTLINNVETLANIPIIIINGGNWFSKIGAQGFSGTKCVTLTGKISNPCVAEVPTGTTLRDIIYDIGRGVPQGLKFKAALIGCPSGGFLPEDKLNLTLDDSLTKAGVTMGSGGIMIIDERTCIVNIVKSITEFFIDESCGLCVPCRVGLPKVNEILNKIVTGEGSLEDIKVLEELSYTIKDTSLCGLGQGAPNPLLTSLNYFKEEYLAHVLEKKCPAGECFSNKEERVK
ncbi:MAG: NADH-ubiquinone oxidoreductase-F iron-sulfur binding region domain-containing protein [Nitrososphaeria archaeon]